MSASAGAPLVLVRGSLPQAALDDLRAEFSTLSLAVGESAASLGDRRSDVRALVALGTVGAGEQMMAELPALEMIAVFGAGFDGVDVEAARRRSIRVANTAGVLTEDTADYAFALLLALSRRLVAGDRYVRAGQWGAVPFADGVRLGGRTLGIVGMGRIGQAVARRALAFGMEIAWHGPRSKPELPYAYFPSLLDLARRADALILCCPGGPSTAGIVNADVLAALGPTKFLVNVSRGTVVDQEALVSALVEGRLGGAALDVFLNEPNVPAALLGLENVILEPHIASGTAETRRDIGRLMVRNLMDHFNGLPLNGRLVC